MVADSMPIQLNEDHRALADAAAAFARGEIAPTVAEDDRDERFRKELVHRLGEQGFCAIPTPESYGGLGLGYLEYAVVLEQIAMVSPAYGVCIAVTGLPQIALVQYGSDELKERYLGRLAAGELLGAFCLSEPGSGSDAASLRTRALRDGDHWLINGSKSWITHGPYADVFLVMARTGGAGARGISAFLVERDSPGLEFGKGEDKMGLRSSPTHTMTFEDVRVPAEHLVGAEGDGFRIAMQALDSGRITIGAIAVGLSQAALDAAAGYACEREQFGRPIIDFQGVSFLLADMAIAVEASRLLVLRAASLKDSDQDFSKVAAMAKCMATDTAMRVTTDAVQVFGGNGYTREYPVERMMRDAKVMQIVEGTNQVQRMVIGRHLARSFER
jgi:cyclohexanecarboxyl-CoA dehydrogenase